MSLISVIVPIYNSENYLKKCIDSILKQSYREFELLLIDDGSMDSSLMICNRYSILDHRVKVYHKQNEGIAKTRNLGLTLSSGEYITFVDSDDYVHRDYLKMLIESIENNDCEMAICSFARFTDDKIFKNKIEYSRIVSKREVEKLIFTNPNIGKANWNKLYKAELIKNVKFPNLCLGEDYVFNFEYLKNVKKIFIIGNELYYYRITPSSLSNITEYNSKKMMDQITSRCSVIDSIEDSMALKLAKTEYMKSVKNAMILFLKSKNANNLNSNDFLYFKNIMKANFNMKEIISSGILSALQICICLYFPSLYSKLVKIRRQ